MIKYSVFITCIFSACSGRNEQIADNTIIFHKFSKVEKANFSNIIKNEDGLIARMYVTDSTLLVYDWMAKNGYFFYEYLLNSKRKVAYYMPLGRTSGKTLGALSTGLYKSSIWLFDINLKKIISLKLTANDAISITYKEFPFQKFYYGI